MEMEIISIYGVSLIALTNFLTQIFKKFVSENYKPLLPLVIGIILVCLSTSSFGTQYILGGLVIGGLAIGAFKVATKPLVSGTKAIQGFIINLLNK